MNTPVNFELAKLLKEKGFNELCRSYYDKYDLKPQETNIKCSNKRIAESCCTAPTIAEVVMWSFNTHKIWITVDVNINGKFNYLLRQYNSKDRAWEVKNPSSIQEYFNNPDDAYSSGVTYFLNNLEMSK